MRSEEGSISIIGAAVLVLVLALGIGLSVVAVVVNARAMASTAADAAALGAAPATFPALGLGSPETVAAEMAARNGAALVSCSCRSDSSWATRSVLVGVSVEMELPVIGVIEIGAVSRAEFEPVALTRR